MNRKALYKDYYDLPSFEGVLQYDPQEIVEDEPLTFYRIRRIRNREGRMVTIRYPLKVFVGDAALSQRLKGSNVKPMYRRRVQTRINGILHKLSCSQLTMLAVTGFSIADRRHYVVDHIDGDSLNDRPSNLQVISQSENLRKSPKVLEQAKKALQLANLKLKEHPELRKRKKQ